MKTSSFFGIVIGAALFLSSCQKANVKMHTIVHEDGFCERQISYSTVMSKEMRDSLWQGDVVRLAQPIPECLNTKAFMGTHTEVEGDTVTTTFSREFHSAEEMCQQTPLQLNGTRLKSQAKLEEHFRWFYTEYTFTEVFYCVGDTFKIAPTNYADKDVISFWFTGHPNLIEGLSGAEASEKLSNMEPFVSKWLNDNLYQVCFDYIVSHYDSIPNPPVSKERFIALRDSVYSYIISKSNNALDIDIQNTYKEFFHSDAYAAFFDDEATLGEGLSDKLSTQLNIFGFDVPYVLTMPGTVWNPGTGVIKNGDIYYQLTGERLIPGDYTITATSRVTHIWAYIVTVLIIILAIFLVFYRGKANRK